MLVGIVEVMQKDCRCILFVTSQLIHTERIWSPTVNYIEAGEVESRMSRDHYGLFLITTTCEKIIWTLSLSGRAIATRV